MGLFSRRTPTTEDLAKTESVNEQQMVKLDLEPIKQKLLVAKEILADWERNKTVLSSVQLHLLAKSIDLELRHYTEFIGKTPPDKIFMMPKLMGKKKIYKVTDYCATGWSGIKETLEKGGVHGVYFTSEEKDKLITYFKSLERTEDSTAIKNVTFHTVEYPAVFILAPTELFQDPKANALLDPIVVEMVGTDEYQISSFWNVPEKVAVKIANPNHN